MVAVLAGAGVGAEGATGEIGATELSGAVAAFLFDLDFDLAALVSRIAAPPNMRRAAIIGGKKYLSEFFFIKDLHRGHNRSAIQGEAKSVADGRSVRQVAGFFLKSGE